jgi:hypothetical protein
MIEIKRRRHEKDAFDISGRFSDASAHKALLDATGHLSSVRLYLSGLSSGNSSALAHFVWGLERNDYPPITHCEVSDYWLRCLNLVPQMLRPKDTIESMVIALCHDETDRDAVLYVGKDIPLQDSYEEFEFTRVIEGKTFELAVHPVVAFEVLTRMKKDAKNMRSAS